MDSKSSCECLKQKSIICQRPSVWYLEEREDRDLLFLTFTVSLFFCARESVKCSTWVWWCHTWWVMPTVKPWVRWVHQNRAIPTPTEELTENPQDKHTDGVNTELQLMRWQNTRKKTRGLFWDDLIDVFLCYMSSSFTNCLKLSNISSVHFSYKTLTHFKSFKALRKKKHKWDLSNQTRH